MASKDMKKLSALLVALGLLAGVTACTSAPTAPEGDGPVVAFYGDSYTSGMGASDPSKRWSTIICEQRGWAEFNPSVVGLGFVNNRQVAGDGDLPSLIIDQDPSIVIVTMGLNDAFSFDVAASEIKQQIAADLERFSTALPDARIIVVEPFWHADDRPESLETIAGWVRGAAADIDADYIAGASRWLQGHPEWMSWDRLHPNDEGYAVLASRMDEELTRLGLPG
ncbi:MAG: SGNH/GDSL hydrolase family protein [Homoserinimonas sp.]